MNTIRKEAAFDAASFCMRMKKEAARGRPYGAAEDRTKRRGDLWSPDRTRQKEAAKGRPYEAGKAWKREDSESQIVCRTLIIQGLEHIF